MAKATPKKTAATKAKTTKATATKATATKTPAAAAMTPKSPEKKIRVRIGRTIGRGVWLTGFRAENPTATKEERRAAWNEARKDFTKIGLRALKTLEKTGYEVVEKTTS